MVHGTSPYVDLPEYQLIMIYWQLPPQRFNPIIIPCFLSIFLSRLTLNFISSQSVIPSCRDSTGLGKPGRDVVLLGSISHATPPFSPCCYSRPAEKPNIEHLIVDRQNLSFSWRLPAAHPHY